MIFAARPSPIKLSSLGISGSDFTSSLNSILSTLPYNAFIVFDEARQYTFSGSIVISKPVTIGAVTGSSFTFTGSSHAFLVNTNNVFINGISCSYASPSSYFLIKVTNGSYFTARNCVANNMGLVWFTNGGSGNSVECRVLNSTSNNPLSNGLTCSYVENLLIDSVTVNDSSVDGIKLSQYANNVKITNCTISSCADSLIDVFSGGINVEIKDCIFNDGNITIKNGDINNYVSQIENISVLDNYFTNGQVYLQAPWDGVSFFGLDGVEIKYNEFHNSSMPALACSSAVNYDFSYNHVYLSNYQTAISIRPPFESCIISNNHFESDIPNLDTNESKGIYMILTQRMQDSLQGTEYTAGNMVFSNNTVIGGRRSFGTDGCTSYTISGNTISGMKESAVYQNFKTSENTTVNGYSRVQSNNTIS